MIREPESSMVSPPIDAHYRPPADATGDKSLLQRLPVSLQNIHHKEKSSAAMPEYILRKDVYCNASTPSINTLPSVGPRRPLVHKDKWDQEIYLLQRQLLECAMEQN